MVTFFNKKEEVIDLQLTEYGKYLLSMGRFSPEYYAFFDDEILYDSRYGGFFEHQNEAEQRIKNETPSLKIVPTITSAETRVNQFTDNLMSAYTNNNVDPLSSDIAQYFNQQTFEEKVDLLGAPLGNSSLSTDKVPAWSIFALHNELSAASPPSDTYTSRNESISGLSATEVGGPVEQIPQINIEVDYQLYAKSGEFNSSVGVGSYINSDLYLAIKRNYLFLEVLEENTDYMKENFDIEVFYSGSADPNSPREPLKSMSFINLTEPGSVEVPVSIGNSDNLTPTVDYYMTVLVDNEIPQNYILESGADEHFVTRTSERLPLQRDLYQTEEEDPC